MLSNKHRLHHTAALSEYNSRNDQTAVACLENVMQEVALPTKFVENMTHVVENVTHESIAQQKKYLEDVIRRLIRQWQIFTTPISTKH